MFEGEGRSSGEPAAVMLEKANKFLETLHPPQRDLTPDNEYALLGFSDDNRQVFDYFAPSSRFCRGLPLRYMNPNQRRAATELLRSSLSENGFQKVQQIHLLEEVLAAREKNNPIYIRDSQAYYVAIFGTPSPQGRLSTDGAWGWRYEGHHLSLHWTLLSGKIISSTPQFLGAQPAEIKEGDVTFDDLPVGTRVLGPEEDLARNLIESLMDEQKLIARSEVPWDIETTNVRHSSYERRPHRLEDRVRGIAYKDLAEGRQRDLLKDLVEQHTTVQQQSVVKERLAKLETAGWKDVRFFFMGGFTRGDALYYRVRGDTFMIEYINKAFSPSNIPADHQHTVWRDFSGDWGRDILDSHGG